MAKEEPTNGAESDEGDGHKHTSPSDPSNLTDDELRALTRELAGRLCAALDSPLLYLFYPEDVLLTKENAVTVYTLLRQLKTKLPRLAIFVHSGGGDIASAYDIINLARQYTDGEITALVPQYAMSAATLIGVGADSIIMSKLGKLGPLDPSVFHPKLSNWLPVRAITDVPRVLEQEIHKFEGRGTGLRPDQLINIKAQTIIKPMADQVDPYLLAAHARSSEVARKYGERVMSLRKTKVAPERISKCLQHFTVGYPIHGFELDLMELQGNAVYKTVVNAVAAPPKIEGLMMDLLTTFMVLEQKHRQMGEPLEAPLIDLIRPKNRHNSRNRGKRPSETKPTPARRQR